MEIKEKFNFEDFAEQLKIDQRFTFRVLLDYSMRKAFKLWWIFIVPFKLGMYLTQVLTLATSYGGGIKFVLGMALSVVLLFVAQLLMYLNLNSVLCQGGVDEKIGYCKVLIKQLFLNGISFLIISFNINLFNSATDFSGNRIVFYVVSFSIVATCLAVLLFTVLAYSNTLKIKNKIRSEISLFNKKNSQ